MERNLPPACASDRRALRLVSWTEVAERSKNSSFGSDCGSRVSRKILSPSSVISTLPYRDRCVSGSASFARNASARRRKSLFASLQLPSMSFSKLPNFPAARAVGKVPSRPPPNLRIFRAGRPCSESDTPLQNARIPSSLNSLLSSRSFCSFNKCPPLTSSPKIRIPSSLSMHQPRSSSIKFDIFPDRSTPSEKSIPFPASVTYRFRDSRKGRPVSDSPTPLKKRRSMLSFVTSPSARSNSRSADRRSTRKASLRTSSISLVGVTNRQRSCQGGGSGAFKTP
mmetsp:Transcript_23540/g.46267  ORF Transcript_23540/g.46267 Transcript_23540/m.46267 type:complete len:282 (-) Transcript_23540:218-1063(-)